MRCCWRQLNLLLLLLSDFNNRKLKCSIGSLLEPERFSNLISFLCDTLACTLSPFRLLSPLTSLNYGFSMVLFCFLHTRSKVLFSLRFKVASCQLLIYLLHVPFLIFDRNSELVNNRIYIFIAEMLDLLRLFHSEISSCLASWE